MKLRQIKRRASLKRGFRWGKRCPNYYSGCIICEAWDFYDNNKRWLTFEEAMDICLAKDNKGAKP